MDGRIVQKRLNALERREATTILLHYIVQELTHHIVHRCPPLGRHGPSLAQ
jgi:hypothetical protein